MQRALLLLSKLRLKAGWRKLLRTLKTPKGALLTLVSTSLIGMMVLPAIFMPTMPENPMRGLLLHPTMLLFLSVLTVTGSNFKSPIAFSLAEVEFLFPGPFKRRELLIYKLLATVFGALGFALIMPLAMGRTLSLWWLAALLGMWFLAVFIQFMAVVVGLALDRFGVSRGRWRTAIMVVSLVVIAAALWNSEALAVGVRFPERVRAVFSSPVMMVLSAPFVPFSRALLATDAATMLPWAAASLALVCAACGMIVGLDANFLEASLAASQRRYDWLQRVKRSGGMQSVLLRGKPRIHLPQLPRMRGAGPIAWRQLLQFIRTSGSMIFLLPMIIGMLVPALSRSSDRPLEVLGPMVSMAFIIGMFITNILPIGLRSELDHFDTIRSLPISPVAVVWGSLGAAILYPTLLQWLVLIIAAAATGAWHAVVWVSLAFTVPVNLLLIGSDSLLVMLFPTARKLVPGDSLAGAKMMSMMLGKFLILGLAAAAAVGAAGIAWLIVGENRAILFIAGWLALMVEGGILARIVAVLFDQFDPSTLAAEGE